MKHPSLLPLLFGLCLLFFLNYANAQEPASAYDSLFQEVCTIIEQNFYDSVKVKKLIAEIKPEFRKEAGQAENDMAFAKSVNSMLKKLKTSHTYYLTPADWEYYQLSAIFAQIPAIKAMFGSSDITYPSIGIMTKVIGQQTFISCVLPGSPAETAGLLEGDEILFNNGNPFEPVLDLHTNGQQVVLSIRRSATGSGQSVPVQPVWVNPKEELLEAEKASIRVLEEDSIRVGYIHIYSYAGREYHDALEESIAWGELGKADALIIDLRYGLGGASPSYLNIFNQQIPQFHAMDRNGNRFEYDTQWRKPAVYLVNNDTRSGKELLAYGAKKYKLATVIGEKTAGAVTAGQLFPLSNGHLLYLAVRGAQIDGEVLEGKGVKPDINVPFDFRYSAGSDLQIDRAMKYLIEEVRKEKG